MYLPEYTITNHTLNNIAAVEYAKAIIETTTILQSWESQLVIEAKARTITYSLQRAGYNCSLDAVQKYLNKMPTKVPDEVRKYNTALIAADKLSQNTELQDEAIKELQKILTGIVRYRQNAVEGSPKPSEILAELTELLDWYSSLDAKETHPLISTAILRLRFEQICPFSTYPEVLLDLVTYTALKISKHNMRDLLAIPEYLYRTNRDYVLALKDAAENEDCTKWLEYFTDVFSRETYNISEKIKVLAHNTQIAKVSGRAKLSQREERIVTYLQNYGMLQNKDFATVFSDISEDTVLRDLKKLIKMGIVVKLGKTKSSRYELS